MQVRVRLPQTRTHVYRDARWQQMHARAGVLEVWEGRDARSAKRTGRYFVREYESTYCRRFKVTKEVKEGGESYWVGIGAVDSCDCQGNESHGICKHVDAVKAIIETGQFSNLPMDSYSEDLDYLIGELE